MKRFHILLVFGAFSALAIAVGYSDSHVTKKDSIQVDQRFVTFVQVVNLQIELPADFVIEHPDLGRPATNHVEVSEELTSVPVMRARPPPEKVQKSDYTKIT